MRMNSPNPLIPSRNALRLCLGVRSACAISLLLALPGRAAVPATESMAYPERPIRVLVGFAPGGATDITARAIAAKLGAAIGQEIVIDNRPGAAGNVATEIAAKAMPDGHTVLMGTIAALAI